MAWKQGYAFETCFNHVREYYLNFWSSITKTHYTLVPHNYQKRKQSSKLTPLFIWF